MGGWDMVDMVGMVGMVDGGLKWTVHVHNVHVVHSVYKKISKIILHHGFRFNISRINLENLFKQVVHDIDFF